MTALPYQNKISADGPSETTTFEVERFQVDNYAIRASKGFNSNKVEHSITWIGLTTAEFGILKTELDNARGTSTFDWTPPTETSAQKFTVVTYSVILQNASGNGTRTFNVNARLNKEYDL